MYISYYILFHFFFFFSFSFFLFLYLLLSFSFFLILFLCLFILIIIIIVSYTQPQCSQNVRQEVYSYLSLFLLCLKYNPIKVNDNDIKSLIERIILGLGDCNNSHIVINSIECLNSCLLLFSDNNSILIKSYPTIITSLLEHTQKISFF